MKVYLAQVHWHYDDTETFGVYLTCEGAWACLKREMERVPQLKPSGEIPSTSAPGNVRGDGETYKVVEYEVLP